MVVDEIYIDERIKAQFFKRFGKKNKRIHENWQFDFTLATQAIRA